MKRCAVGRMRGGDLDAIVNEMNTVEHERPVRGTRRGELALDGIHERVVVA